MWPRLSLAQWEDTYSTLHRWTQIVGKIRLSQMPWINHSWHVPLYVTVRGLTTSILHHGNDAFEIEFDFSRHRLNIETSGGARGGFTLEPMTTAVFYEQIMAALAGLGINVQIWPMPVEIPGAVRPFNEDEQHAAYDADAVQRCWQALVHIHRVFTHFRARFTGKVSPVHFFWGAFDLAVTRFSGAPAPKHPGSAPHMADWIMQEAYSHEVSSAGFWPGMGLGEAAFYAYAYPEPPGFRTYTVRPEGAYYHADLGEFILPYEAVRTAANPDEALMAFLQSTYEAAAEHAGWNRQALEQKMDKGPGDSSLN